MRTARISEVSVLQTDFPKHFRTLGKYNPIQTQLAFGQLNTACQKQGESVKSLEYQSRELEAHYDCLKFFNNRKFSKDFSYAFTLGLNKWSNNFGRSWTRAVIFTFVVGVFSYYLVVINSLNFHLAFAIDINEKLIKSFFSFMNPLRTFNLREIFEGKDKQPYLELSVFSHFVDFFARLIIAYGYYQTIQAFRRFGRK